MSKEYSLTIGINRTEVMQVLPQIEAIGPEDKNLLQSAIGRFRPQSQNYEDSWGYVIQATRQDGLRWHDPESGSLVFFGRKSATDPTLVVPSFFAEPGKLAHAIESVQSTLNAPKTIIKNVNPEDVSKFIVHGFRPYRDGEGWDPEARFDDQTFPEQIVDLEKLMAKRGKEYHHLRKALNKNPDVSVRSYRDEDETAVQGIFRLKDKNVSAILGEGNMYLDSHAMYPRAEIDKFVTVDNLTGEIVGFSATSDISEGVIASVASQFRPDAINSRIWATYQIWAKKYEEGVRQVNLGGSEFESTYNFRRRTFRPVELLEKTHLVYER